MRHARAVVHVRIANPRLRGKRSRHSRRMRNPQSYVSGKRSITNVNPYLVASRRLKDKTSYHLVNRSADMHQKNSVLPHIRASKYHIFIKKIVHSLIHDTIRSRTLTYTTNITVSSPWLGPFRSGYCNSKLHCLPWIQLTEVPLLIEGQATSWYTNTYGNVYTHIRHRASLAAISHDRIHLSLSNKGW